MQLSGVIGGRFEIREAAGIGGGGTVYRAWDRQMARLVAVKVLHASEVRDLARFTREMTFLESFSHPGIVGYVGRGALPGGGFYLVMEWIEGETLSTRLARDGLTAAESVAMVRRIAEALALVHDRGMVHRDIKPSNLILAGGELEAVRIIDFGIARLAHDPQKLTQTGMMVGTLGYMSPEQALGQRVADVRVDVFSLGCVLYECLAGRRPFLGYTPASLRAKIIMVDPPPLSGLCPEAPAPLVELVDRMLAKNPEQRPGHAGEVAACLAKITAPQGPRRSLGSNGPVAPSPPISTATNDLWLFAILVGIPCASDSGPEPAFTEATADLTAMLPVKPLALVEALAPYGATVNAIDEGIMLATVEAVGSLAECARRATGVADQLRELLPESPIVIIARHGAFTSRSFLLGDAVEQGVLLLSQAELAVVSNPGSYIVVDDTAAGVLAGEDSANRFQALGKTTRTVG